MNNQHDTRAIHTDPVSRFIAVAEDHGCHPKRRGNVWTLDCPAHDDRVPSVSVTSGRDGRCLVFCFAGCSTSDVVGALGLSLADLFVSPPPPSPRLPSEHIGTRRLSEALRERERHPIEFLIASVLAPLPVALQRQDLLACWDALCDRIELSRVWSMALAIRGAAIYRFMDASSVQDEQAVSRAVHRLLREVGGHG